ncbi:cytochrome o ubiquinol oxidase subunit I, partial [Burkholderia pseudomallei]|nr:cytochrome o ubiquinol oxidase subunit I [Burkholderia pseudomallei]
MPSNTSAGLFVGVFSLVLGFAAVWHIWWLAIAALAGIVVTVIAYSAGENDGYYIPADAVRRIEEKRGGARVVARPAQVELKAN